MFSLTELLCSVGTVLVLIMGLIAFCAGIMFLCEMLKETATVCGKTFVCWSRLVEYLRHRQKFLMWLKTLEKCERSERGANHEN